jgi:hypothetical protein
MRIKYKAGMIVEFYDTFLMEYDRFLILNVEGGLVDVIDLGGRSRILPRIKLDERFRVISEALSSY